MPEADTKGAVILKVLFKRDFKTRTGQPACSLSLVDANGKYCRITFVGQPPPAGCDEGSYVEVNGVIKAPNFKYCAAGFACEIQPKTATIKSVQPTDEMRLEFPQDGALPALTNGAQLSAVATVSAANGFEKSVKGKVNVALMVLGPGTSYEGASCERYKTLCWLSSGEQIWVTVWDPSADTEETMSAGKRVFGENLTLGCHDGEISLSGSPGQFSSSAICVATRAS